MARLAGMSVWRWTSVATLVIASLSPAYEPIRWDSLSDASSFTTTDLDLEPIQWDSLQPAGYLAPTLDSPSELSEGRKKLTERNENDDEEEDEEDAPQWLTPKSKARFSVASEFNLVRMQLADIPAFHVQSDNLGNGQSATGDAFWDFPYQPSYGFTLGFDPKADEEGGEFTVFYWYSDLKENKPLDIEFNGTIQVGDLPARDVGIGDRLIGSAFNRTNLIDAMFSYQQSLGSRMFNSGQIGFRYYDGAFFERITVNRTDGSVYTNTRDRDYHGYGPQTSLRSSLQLDRKGRILLMANVGASVLFGKLVDREREIDTFAAMPVDAFKAFRQNVLAPTADVEVSAKYRFDNGLELRAGYLFFFFYALGPTFEGLIFEAGYRF